MFKLAASAVVPEDICRDIEERDNFGRMAMGKFVTTRMTKKQTTSGILKRKGLAHTLNTLGLLQKLVSGQIVTIKQQIALSTIEDIKCNVGSPSIFYPHRSMIMKSDKTQVVYLISNMLLPDGAVIDNEIGVRSVMIIDAICVWSIW